ncbi:hypothetical protein CB1_001954010 [Camelus ferus]|nr:hypothetical protein CB1_001954010 [Camelus ferus]
MLEEEDMEDKILDGGWRSFITLVHVYDLPKKTPKCYYRERNLGRRHSAVFVKDSSNNPVTLLESIKKQFQESKALQSSVSVATVRAVHGLFIQIVETRRLGMIKATFSFRHFGNDKAWH